MAALIWPIKAKGAVQRVQPLGDPQIEQFYHNSMEQGRFLESSIADANNWLLQKKTLLNEYVISYTHMNSLAVDGQLGHDPRVPKFVADSISILQTAQRLQQELVSLAVAVEQNLTQITAIAQSMLQMVTTASNSLANLLNNICNWGIPALPSIPNLFPDSIWNWNGYTFSPLALFALLKSDTQWNFNFSFDQCSFGSTAPSYLFVDNPLTTQTYSGLVYGSANYYAPPLGGQPTPVTQDLTDPVFIAQMQATTASPIYSPSFNPSMNMFGAVPDPHYVISNFQMPAATYTADIVSICPELRSNTVPQGAPDYASPNLTVRNPQLRKDLIHFVNLAGIVQSNFDPFVVSAWLLYLSLARQGRGGLWIPNFEAVYQQYIQPSVNGLLSLSVPWNDVLGETNYVWMGTWNASTAYVQNDVVVFNGVNYAALVSSTGAEPDASPADWSLALANTVYSDTPVIPLIATFQSLSQNQSAHLLWQLSYVEASLLGYTRNRTWDTNQDANYLSGPTEADLDYRSTVFTATQSSLVLGKGTAEFPVPITFPTVMGAVLNQVVALATTNILDDVDYLSPRLGNRFTYDQFAQAKMVDRFSQFWRDFATNLTNFLAQDPYLVQFAITYPEILDGALDPLASTANTATYASLQGDVSSRSRSWTPGTPLLPIPVAPITGIPNNSIPTANTNGWIDNADLNPVAFLARPDIIVLPIPVQTAMLRTNLSYAGLQKWKNLFQASVATNIANANALLQAVQQIGFEVNVAANSIMATSIATNVLTALVNNTYQPGDSVLLEGTDEAFLNGQIVVVTASSATQFAAAFAHADYSNPSDKGTASLVTYVPFGTSVPVGFDTIDFDFTGNVDAAPFPYDTFTIRTAGPYSGVGSVVFVMPASGTATVTVTQNAVAIATASVTGPGTVTVPFSFIGTFSTNDVVQVLASTNLVSGTAEIISGSVFSMILSQVSPGGGGSSTAQGNTQSLIMDVPFYLTSPIPAFTAVSVDSSGHATPLDTTAPVITNVAESAGNVLTVTADNHLSVGDLITFRGTSVATYLSGVVTTVASLIGVSPNFTGFTANDPTLHGAYPSTPDTGNALYAIDASGALLAPNSDGVALASATNGSSVLVTTYYGAEYFVSGVPSPFVAGGLLYVGPGGVLTQDFTTLITQVSWILCIGRVTAYDVPTATVTFIYEPHLATLFI